MGKHARGCEIGGVGPGRGMMAGVDARPWLYHREIARGVRVLERGDDVTHLRRASSPGSVPEFCSSNASVRMFRLAKYQELRKRTIDGGLEGTPAWPQHTFTGKTNAETVAPCMITRTQSTANLYRHAPARSRAGC